MVTPQDFVWKLVIDVENGENHRRAQNVNGASTATSRATKPAPETWAFSAFDANR
jgi:hypothetical protein